MIKLSSGLRTSVMGNYGIGVMMNGGIIRLYGGTMPVTPDNPPGTPELGRITTMGKTFYPGTDPEGAGLQLALVSPGALIRNVEYDQWRLRGITSGTVTWWRWVWALEDPLTYSTYYPRIDGDVIDELSLANAAITQQTNQEITDFLFMLPMSL